MKNIPNQDILNDIYDNLLKKENINRAAFYNNKTVYIKKGTSPVKQLMEHYNFRDKDLINHIFLFSADLCRMIPEYYRGIVNNEFIYKVLISPAFQLMSHKEIGSDEWIGKSSYFNMFPSPYPLFLDIEVTTKCNLKCDKCARTIYNMKSEDMVFDYFCEIIDSCVPLLRINFVGLGEPLMNPDIFRMINYCSSKGIITSLVTNGMLLNRDNSEKLIDSGLNELTFSIDGADDLSFKRERGGANLNKFIANIKEFNNVNKEKMMGLNRKEGVGLSFFSALSSRNINELPGIINIAHLLGIPAIGISELNFKENQGNSINWAKDKYIDCLKKSIKIAFNKGIFLINVHVLDSVIPKQGYIHFLVKKPEMPGRRSLSHKYCIAPWRTIVVNVDGSISICNCTPDRRWGTISGQEVKSKLWRDKYFIEFRKKIRSSNSPSSCQICPRF